MCKLKQTKTRISHAGVDVEVWVIPQCNINHENKHKMERVRFLLDVTIAHLICHSYLDTTIASAVTAKVSEKTARYVTSGMIPAEVFRVGVMFSQNDGVLGAVRGHGGSRL